MSSVTDGGESESNVQESPSEFFQNSQPLNTSNMSTGEFKILLKEVQKVALFAQVVYLLTAFSKTYWTFSFINIGNSSLYLTTDPKFASWYLQTINPNLKIVFPAVLVIIELFIRHILRGNGIFVFLSSLLVYYDINVFLESKKALYVGIFLQTVCLIGIFINGILATIAILVFLAIGLLQIRILYAFHQLSGDEETAVTDVIDSNNYIFKAVSSWVTVQRLFLSIIRLEYNSTHPLIFACNYFSLIFFPSFIGMSNSSSTQMVIQTNTEQYQRIQGNDEGNGSTSAV